MTISVADGITLPLGGTPGPAGPAGAVGAPGTPGTDVGTYLISGGEVFRVGTTGYNFTITAARYMINGVQYNSPETNLNLTGADATLNRLDAFVLTSSSTAIAVAGVPATNPAEPSLDLLTQLKRSLILVPAASTNASVTNTNIYLENTEWTSSVSGNINADSTTNPYAGTKSIQATLAAAGAYVNLSNGAVFDTTTRNMLFLEVRPGVWPNAKSVVLQFYSGTGARGTPVVLKNGNFNLDTSLSTTYQLIGIPMSAFGAGGIAVDAFRGTVTGGGAAMSFNIDNIIMQGGLAPAVPSPYMRWMGVVSPLVQYVINDVVRCGTGLYIAPGTMAPNSPLSTWTRLDQPNRISLTNAATVVWNTELSENAYLFITGNCAMGAPSPLQPAGTYILLVQQDGTGGRTMSWNAVFKWPGGVAPVLSTAIGAIDIFTFVSDGTNLYGVAQKGFA